MTKRIRVGLLGAGRIGAMHGRTLAYETPEAELVVIADAIPAAAERLANELGIERWTGDPESVLDDASIDAVVIASSTDSHAPLIIGAAKAGKDIFCEKPVALDLESTDRALAALADAGVRLQIGLQRRFDRGYVRAKELIDAGALGEIESLHDVMRDPAPPTKAYLKTSGGLFRDMTIHNFDAARWLVGADVESVFAVGSAVTDPMFAEVGDIDTGFITLQFANGAIAGIENGRRSNFGYDVRTEIFGSKGAVFVGYSRETPVLQYLADGVKSDHVQMFLDRFAEAYRAEIQAFIRCIVEDKTPSPTGQDARAALLLAYAAEESRRQGCLVAVDAVAKGQQS